MKTLVILGTLSLVVLSAPAMGQAEWTSVAKISNGTCGDGSVAHVTERPGTMNLRLVFPDGKQYAHFDVPLAADGSGKAEFKGFGGNVRMEVSPGQGKRLLKTSQTSGTCQWNWQPR